MKTVRPYVKGILKRTLQVFAPRIFSYRLSQNTNVSITFDDGPHQHYTKKVLDVLRSYGVHCTFFLVGRAAKEHPELVNAIFKDGHTIGLHTYSHTTLDEMTEDQFRQEVRRNQDVIERIIGVRPFLLRPPEGRLKMQNLFWARRLGVKLIHYTITSNDWKATKPEDVIRDVNLALIRGGEIISFHDTNPYTVVAMSTILQGLRERELTVIPLLAPEIE